MVARSAPAGAAAIVRTVVVGRVDQKNARSSLTRARADDCFLLTLMCSTVIGDCRWPLRISRAAGDVLFTPKQCGSNATERVTRLAQRFLVSRESSKELCKTTQLLCRLLKGFLESGAAAGCVDAAVDAGNGGGTYFSLERDER